MDFIYLKQIASKLLETYSCAALYMAFSMLKHCSTESSYAFFALLSTSITAMSVSCFVCQTVRHVDILFYDLPSKFRCNFKAK